VHRFIARHADKITGVLRGFDRLVFRGHLRPLCHEGGVRAFLASQGVLLKHFGKFAEATTTMIGEGAAGVADRLGIPVRYLESSRIRKESVAHEFLAERPIRSGAICMLSAVEPCSSWQVFRSRKARTQTVQRRLRKCLHHYHYFVDRELGFCHVRIQTWMPYAVQICINGREWLGRQLDHARLRYDRADNCFPRLASPERAQEIMDHMPALPWPTILGDLVNRANPVLAAVNDAVRSERYWTVHQAEWATDVMFEDSASLARSYPALVRHAMTDFHSPDVLRFLAKPPSISQPGEVTSDYKRRIEGVRVKHTARANSVKMYDKAGSVLRVETTINQPGEFKVRRRAQDDPCSENRPRPLRKGIADIKPLARAADRSNRAYLDALAVVDDSDTVGDVIMPVTGPASIGGRRVRGLRPWAEPDLPLLRAIGHGEFVVNGFRNRDILPLLFPGEVDADDRKKLSSKVTRLLRLLRAHGVIEKIAGTHRYRVTQSGRRLISAVVAAGAASLSQLKQCA
jgi:hypothetical protein